MQTSGYWNTGRLSGTAAALICAAGLAQAADPLEATMMLPKDGKDIWTDIMQNPTEHPEGIGEGDFLVSSYAQFPDGVFVYGGVAAGPADLSYNYAMFMVFDADYQQIGGYPIDPSDWEDFRISEISFSTTDSDEDAYLLKVVEAE